MSPGLRAFTIYGIRLFFSTNIFSNLSKSEIRVIKIRVYIYLIPRRCYVNPSCQTRRFLLFPTSLFTPFSVLSEHIQKMEGSQVRKSDCQNDDVDVDDTPTLSSHALAALQEFLGEQNRTVETGEREAVELLSEDWRLSQFWYDAATAETVAHEVLSLCSDSSCRVACIACPTLYAYLKNIDPNVPAQLFEYDKRFGQYGSEFTFYDYNQPEELPLELKHAFNIVVADPPYLSKECLEKVSQTVSFLACSAKPYLLLLTGEVQKNRAAELLGLHPCGFRPQHSSKLGNEFRLFTNYDPGTRLGGWEQAK